MYFNFRFLEIRGGNSTFPVCHLGALCAAQYHRSNHAQGEAWKTLSSFHKNIFKEKQMLITLEYRKSSVICLHTVRRIGIITSLSDLRATVEQQAWNTSFVLALECSNSLLFFQLMQEPGPPVSSNRRLTELAKGAERKLSGLES